MKKLMIRASAMKMLMTKSRSKSDPLSETTKSYLMKLAKEEIYGYREELHSKQITKGVDCEQMSIDLLNEANFENYEKNADRFFLDSNQLTGEPDIITDDKIIDVKTSWSLSTFPAFKYEAQKLVKSSGYDYQMQAYMLLVDRPKAEVSFCMVDTPAELLNEYDDFNFNIHRVNHINPSLRITTVEIERDPYFMDKFMQQYELANEFYQTLIK